MYNKEKTKMNASSNADEMNNKDNVRRTIGEDDRRVNRESVRRIARCGRACKTRTK